MINIVSLSDSDLGFFKFKMSARQYNGTVFSSKIIEFSLDVFRDKLGLKSTYTPRYITANIIPKLKKDLSKYYKSFDISYLREGKQKVVGYRLTW